MVDYCCCIFYFSKRGFQDMTKQKTQFHFSVNVLRIPFMMLFLIWALYWVEIKFHFNFTKYGIFPRRVSGLQGVVFGPFIHGSAKHLFNNSFPMVIFVGMLFYFYRQLAKKVLLFGFFTTGLLTWCIGVSAYHIGMSGLVYMLFSFLFFSGVLRKYYRLIAVSLVVIFMYGSMVWYLFPVEKGISWEGHVSGFITGLFLAGYYRKKGPQKLPYEFVKNEFDTWFDDQGNFNPPKEVNEATSENL
jgi:membrane associated rhomboid family serine protease